MGFFTKLFGMDGKEQLIRSLLKKRISEDPSTAGYGQGPEYADKISFIQLMGHAEATIVTCVQNWKYARDQGSPDVYAASMIANHRNAPPAGTVEEVIHTCVEQEHGHSGFLPSSHIDWCIEEAKKYYGI